MTRYIRYISTFLLMGVQIRPNRVVRAGPVITLPAEPGNSPSSGFWWRHVSRVAYHRSVQRCATSAVRHASRPPHQRVTTRKNPPRSRSSLGDSGVWARHPVGDVARSSSYRW